MADTAEKLLRLEREVDQLKNDALVGFEPIVFTADDLKPTQSGYLLSFTCEKDCRALFKMRFSGLGSITIDVNGIPCAFYDLSSDDRKTFGAFIFKGDVSVGISTANAVGFALNSAVVSGYVSVKRCDAKIYAVDLGPSGLLCSYSDVTGKVNVDLVGANNLHFIDEYCSCAALSDVGSGKVVCSAISGNYLKTYLIDVNYGDVMGQAQTEIEGLNYIVGAADGVFYALTDKAAVKKMTVDTSLNVTVSDTGVRAKRLIGSPTCSSVIIVGLNDKAVLTDLR